MFKAKSIAPGVDPKKAQKMLTMRWVFYGMFLLTYIFVYFDRVAPAVVAPELMKEFGLTAVALGILSSMYFYPYAAMQIPAGVLSDTIGPRMAVTIFFILAAIGTALFGIAGTFGLCIFGRFLMGVGVAVVWMPCMRILYNWFRPNELATLTGMMLTWGNVGAILASAPLAFLVGIVGWRNSFFYLGAAMLVIAILNYIIIRNKPSDMGLPTVSEIDGVDYYNVKGSKDGQAQSSFKENFFKLMRMRNYWLISVYAFFIYGTVMGFQGLWFIPYIQHIYGLTKQQAANMLMMWPIGMALGCFLIGLASDRLIKSRRKTSLYFTIGYVLTWVPVVLYTGTIPVNMFYPLLFVMGFFCGAYVPNYAHIAYGQPATFMATSNGMINIWYFVGGATYQTIMGAVLDYYGKVGGKFTVEAYQMTFTVCLVSLVLATIAIFFTTELTTVSEKKKA